MGNECECLFDDGEEGASIIIKTPTISSNNTRVYINWLQNRRFKLRSSLLLHQKTTGREQQTSTTSCRLPLAQAHGVHSLTSMVSSSSVVGSLEAVSRSSLSTSLRSKSDSSSSCSLALAANQFEVSGCQSLRFGKSLSNKTNYKRNSLLNNSNCLLSSNYSSPKMSLKSASSSSQTRLTKLASMQIRLGKDSSKMRIPASTRETLILLANICLILILMLTHTTVQADHHHHHHQHHHHKKHYEAPIVKVIHKTVHIPKAIPVPKFIPVPKIIPVPKTVAVPHPVHISVKVPIYKTVKKIVPVPKKVNVKKPIPVPKPYAVAVPVPVIKHHPVPVYKHVPVHKPYGVPVPYKVPKHVPVGIPKVVHVPKPYPVHYKVPIYKEVIVKKPVEVPVPVYIKKKPVYHPPVYKHIHKKHHYHHKGHSHHAAATSDHYSAIPNGAMMQQYPMQQAYSPYPQAAHQSHQHQAYRVSGDHMGQQASEKQHQQMLTASSNLDPSGSDLISQGSSISTRGVANPQSQQQQAISGDNGASYLAPNHSPPDTMASGSNQVLSTVPLKRQPGSVIGGAAENSQMQMIQTSSFGANANYIGNDQQQQQQQATNNQMNALANQNPTSLSNQMQQQQQQQQYQSSQQQMAQQAPSSSSLFAPRHLMLQNPQQQASELTGQSNQQTFGNGTPLDPSLSAAPPIGSNGGQETQLQSRSPLLNQLSRLWSMVGSRNKSLLASLPPFNGNVHQRQYQAAPMLVAPQQQQQQPHLQQTMQQQPLQLNSIQLASHSPSGPTS